MLVLALLLALAGPPAEPQASDRRPEDSTSYAAHLEAAQSALQRHDVRAARAWLAGAPEAQRGWEWRHLSARSDLSRRSIPAHEGTVQYLELSPDGRTLASAGADGTLQLRTFPGGELVRTWKAEKGNLWKVAFDRSGKRMVTSGGDGRTRVFDAASGAFLLELRGFDEIAWSVDWSADGRTLAVTTLDGKLWLFDAP